MQSDFVQLCRRIVRRVLIVSEFAKDSINYLRFSAPMDRDFPSKPSPRHLEALLTKDYHRVEKGLALRTPKNPFGKAVEERLSRMIPKNPKDAQAAHVSYAVDALEALKTWNSAGQRNGNVTIASSDLPIAKFSEEQLIAFFESRRSVRDFDSSREVEPETLNEATKLAINTPSVCNRQAWRVRYFVGDRAQGVLRHQNGNSGFGDQVPCVAVVTVDTRLFSGPGERNQMWVDGGLFAMSLVWAFHGLGVSSCMLNWSMTNSRSNRLRREAELHPYEQIITMIAVGYAPATFRVARSARRPIQQVMDIVQ